MIEVIDNERCTQCNICVMICPMNVFEMKAGEYPTIPRKSDCQTCFQCEAYCPADAIFVDPSRTEIPLVASTDDIEELRDRDFLGLHRQRVGWRKTPSSRASKTITP